jgi:hypothetical protein
MIVCVMAVSVPTWIVVLGIVALVLMASSFLGGLIGPMPRYKLADRSGLPANDSDRFLQIVEALTDAAVNRTGTLEVLTNGLRFIPQNLRQSVAPRKA